jgi:hypothetical protein
MRDVGSFSGRPRVLEKAYDSCFYYELSKTGLQFEHQLRVPRAQILSYLKLTGVTVGLLVNFNVVHLRDGIRRLVNGYVPEPPDFLRVLRVLCG